MKRVIMKTAFRVVLVAVVALCISLPAFAMSGETAGTSLLFTYYDVRSAAAGGLGLTDNYFTVTNTATDRWVQAHVRIRTGSASIELLDFDILMSPADVFTFDLYEDNGQMVFASCDTKTLVNSGFDPNFDRDNNDATGDAEGDDCFVLDSTSFPAMLSLVQLCYGDEPAATSLARVKKGYVEVIGEGVIWACSTNKNKCWDYCDTDDDTIPGKLLLHCTNDDLSLSNICSGDVEEMYPVLIGRQYFATVSSGVVTRFTQLNGEVLDQYAPLVLHCEDFGTEAASADCVGADAGPCYAYVAADKGDTVAGGADDMNHCLYQDEIDDANDVANKFGAGATFGPTLVDIQTDNPRNGTLARTASKINYIMGYMNDAQSVYNGGGWGTWGNKDWADSHYVAVPGSFLDVSTSFAFIFPFQHFIGERDLITPVAIWDNEENKQTVQLGKFLSPGLPTVSTPGEEASLFKLTNAPFSEGWIRFAITATNSTAGCTETVTNTASCECTNSSSPTDTYTPAYTGAVFNTGTNHISASHFQYNNWEINYDD